MEQEKTYELAIPSPPPAAPIEGDGDPHWQVTLYAMWVAQLISIMGFSFVMPFFPFYIQELGVTDPRQVAVWAGLLATACGVAMTAAAPLWGMVADRVGRRLMVQRAMFGGAVAMGLMGLVHNVHQLLVLRLVQGVLSGTMAASFALVSSVTPHRRMGYSLGLMQMAVFIGASLGPWFGGILADHFGYRIPFAVTAGLLAAGGLLVLFGARERFQRPAPHAGSAAGSLRTLMCLPGIGTMLGVYFMLNLSGTIVGPIFPLFVAHLLATPTRVASTTGMIMAISAATAAVAAVLFGRASDRIGHRRLLIGCIVAAGMLCFPQAAARTVWHLLILRAAYGLAAGGMGPTMNALVATSVPRCNIGSIYGLTSAATSLGAALGPALGGLLAASTNLRMPFVLMGALLLALGIMVRWRVAGAAPAE